MEMLQSLTKVNKSRNIVKSPNNMELAYENVVLEIIEDVVSDLLFKVHRGVKLGYYPVQEYVIKDNEFEIYKASQENGSHVYSQGSDIFGHFKGSQTLLCCPSCRKKMCSSRFSPHLYNCMGFGRRLGKRSTTKRPTLDMYESDHDEDDSSDGASSSKKRRKGKSTRRKAKEKNSESFVISSYEANFGTDMTQETIRECLSQMCGVISGRTGRFCRNTLKCLMHEEDQRRKVRDILLGSNSAVQVADDIHIDVDTVDEDNPVQLWYSNRKTSKKTNLPGESSSSSSVCLSSAAVSSSRQEDNPPSVSQYPSSSYS